MFVEVSNEDRACSEVLLKNREDLSRRIATRFTPIFDYLKNKKTLSPEELQESPVSAKSERKVVWLIELFAAKDKKAFSDFLEALKETGFRYTSEKLQQDMESAVETCLKQDHGESDKQNKEPEPNILMRYFSKYIFNKKIILGILFVIRQNAEKLGVTI